MTSTVKPKSKFSSRNLSAVYKAPSSSLKSTDNAGDFYPSANRMLVLGKSKMSSAAAPAPLNTPSLRKEHHQASSTTGSPARTGWAVPTVAVVTPLSLNTGPSDAETTSRTSPARPSQPNRHTSSPSENVWASGHVAEVINPELAHHHPQQQPTALPETTDGTTGGGRAAGRFARSPFVVSSGRWGDDAVEQDIERWDREKEMKRHREFPDLKEAAQIEEQLHDHSTTGGSAPYPEHRRFDVDRPASRSDHFERGFHRDDEYHSSPYHNNRFGRDDGYDRFDNSRRAWPGRFEAQPAVGGGSAHSHFSPSDARFDGFVARSDVGRTLPSFGGGSSRAGSSHGSVTSASDLDVGHRYPSPPHYSYVPEDEHHHHHEGSDRSPAVSERSAAPVVPSQPIERPLSCRDDVRLPLVKQQERCRSDSIHDEPMNWRQRPKPSETQLERERPAAASNAPRIVSDVERVDGAEHGRKNSSLSRTSSSSSSVDKPSAGVASSNSSVQPATSSPQVRILKRVGAASGGPKMLFDPKTGHMVSAEKEDAPSSNRRRKQQQPPSQQPAVAIEKKQATESVSVEPKPTGDIEPATETSPATKPVTTLMVGDMELPIHDEPFVPFRSDSQSNVDEQPPSEATVELNSDAPVAVDEPSTTTAEILSFKAKSDGKKPKPRRREVVEAKTNKTAAREKLVTRSHERVKAEEHLSRSESTDKKKPKTESRHAASTSPSVSLSTVVTSRDHQEKRPFKGKRREDQKEERKSDHVIGMGAEKKARRNSKAPRNDGTGASKRETRSVVMEQQPTASNGPARQSRRSEKREAHARRKGDESGTTEDAGKPLESSENGFQTVKSRRVLLTEKKQQRQHEPLEEAKIAANEEAGGSVRLQRKQRDRKADQETKGKAVPVAAAPSEVAANASSRNNAGGRRAERQAGGEQVSETAPTPRPERLREPKQQRPSRVGNDEQHGSGPKPRGKQGAPASPEALDAAAGAPTKQTRTKQTSDKRKRRAEKAVKSNSDRRTRPGITTEASAPAESSVSSVAVDKAGDDGVAVATPPTKTSGKPQRKPAVRKVYVVKATSAPALSAA